jgi:diguanylate cyclase (GGDEF)-like protein
MKILIAISSDHAGMELCAILDSEDNECIVSGVSARVVDDVYVNNPDLIILDITLSKPSVFDTLMKLKSAPSTREIPVLMIASRRSAAKLSRCYHLGAYDYISEPFFPAEIKARLRNIGYVAEKMREVEKLLVRDYLTGLYNRKFFMERFSEELAWASRYNEPLSFIILDIDHFKKINDTYGHSSGDEVLRQLACTLSGLLRAHDVFARYGGEEFVALLSNTTNEDACAIADKLRAGVEADDFRCEGNKVKLPVTISLGVSTSVDPSDLSAEFLINQADAALYQAKAAGRNRVVSAFEPAQEKPDAV